MGELQKRIKEIGEFEFVNINDKRLHRTEALLMIVEEMRQEFPKYPKDIYQINPKETIKWFEKWLK